MRRPNSIYDNLNDEETTNLSSELSVNNNDDFDQIQTPNNTLNPSQRKDESFAEEMDTLQKGMLEELESIKRMLTDVNLLFEKNDDTLERPKQERFPMKLISYLYWERAHQNFRGLIYFVAHDFSQYVLISGKFLQRFFFFVKFVWPQTARKMGQVWLVFQSDFLVSTLAELIYEGS